jgi:hypothetical protein
MVQGVPFKTQPRERPLKPFAHKDETSDNIKFLQPHPYVAADAVLEIGTAVILAV